MILHKQLKWFGLSILCTILLINGVSANSYTSELHSSKAQCDIEKQNNDKLYPNFYRSNCVENSEWKYHYNICDTNHCVANDHVDVNKFTEIKDPWVYQYDANSASYNIDEKTALKIQKISAGLEKRFQKMSASDLEAWNTNFLSVMDKMAEKSKDNKKNYALVKSIQSEVAQVIKKQQNENDLCEKQYGLGWKEAQFFF